MAMKRRLILQEEDLTLWGRVTATVKPLANRRSSKAQEIPETAVIKPADIAIVPQKTIQTVKDAPMRLAPFCVGERLNQRGHSRLIGPHRDQPDPIEPNRKRRISRERDPLDARLDLHGLSAFIAENRVKNFIDQAYENGFRSVLIITGKGHDDQGILKRLTPQWLADPALSSKVAGLSFAHMRHGGSGALYVAIKRKS